MDKGKLSENLIKYIHQLQQKKYRKIHNSFFVEGIKLVDELLSSDFEVTHIFSISQELFVKDPEIKQILVSERELKKISSLKTPNKVLAVAKIPDENHLDLKGKISIVLDAVGDPGNLGTIVRLADWFGIENILCSKDTVDLYNPKTIQSTMGSFSRVKVSYLDLEQFLNTYDSQIMGTFLEGESVFETSLPSEGLIVMGSESHGIRESVQKFITQKLTIPRYSTDNKIESLNVAVASAIVLGAFFHGKK